MPRILIKASPRAYYHIASGICVVDLVSALRASLWNLRITLVHEATHVRLEHCGIPYTPALRDRIERFCVAQELALVRRMSDADFPNGNKEQWVEQFSTFVRDGAVARWAELWDQHENERSALEMLPESVTERDA